MAHGSLITPLGPLTVYADADAIIAIDWQDSGCGLLTPLLRWAIEQLGAYFDGGLKDFVLPINPSGTAFQKRSWAALCAIPYGETRSYGAVARELASGPRALAGACARNPLPIIIPCHRVIASDGTIGGYSGGTGIKTKTALLALEQARVPA
jgi:methylated-DNA-[protein]-cysteine S-methyltransferase